MSIACRIRDYIAQKGRPCSVAECAQGLDLDPRMVGWTIGRMHRDGILKRDGVFRSYLYTVAREVPPPMTKEQARARKAERERIRQQTRQRGRQSRAQYLAELAVKREAREAAHKVAREARQSARLERAAVKPVKADRKPQKASRPVAPPVHVAVAPQPAAPHTLPKQPRIETVEEWMQRTGKRPQVLPLGAVSQPLRFIGHKAENEASWHNRSEAA